jgi:hypothetical protein
MWTLKRQTADYGFQPDILSMVDTKTGKITTYHKVDEHIHPNMTPEALKEENFVFPEEYFGGNGYKRLRLAEDGLEEREESL